MKQFLSTRLLLNLRRKKLGDRKNFRGACYLYSVFSGTGLLIALLLLFGTNAAAQDKSLNVAMSGQASVALTPYISVLEDADGTLTLADVLRPDIANRFEYQEKASDAFEFGFTQSAYWLRLSLINPSNRAIKRLLEIDYALLTQLQYFHVVNGKVVEQGVTGIDEMFSSRPFPSRHFVFPVMLPAQGEQFFFLRVKAIDSMVIPARLWSPQAFRDNERSDYVAQAIYLGMASAMILFNLLLFIGGLRDKIYLLYVAYASSLLLSVLGITGLGKQYIWPNLTWMSNVILVAAFALALGALLLFMRRMVGTPSLIPRLDRLLLFFVGLLCIIPGLLIFSLKTFIQFAAITYFVVGIVTLCISIFCAWKRQRSAYFFVAGFMALIFGSLLVIGRALGVVPSNSLTANGIQFGSVCEMLILALALADRYNVLRKEKEQAQLAHMAAQDQLLDTLQAAEKLLTLRVEQRTAELETAIADLEQTQSELVQSAKLAALGSMVAAVSHELNTPLGNAVMSASTIDDATSALHADFEQGRLQKSNLEEYVRVVVPLANLVLKSSQRAADLILSFKRVAVDQSSEKRRVFDLLTLVNDNVFSILPSFKHQTLQIEVRIEAGITCDSYPGPLGQIILNLVQNSFVHGFEGRETGCIVIESRVQGEEIFLSFTDDGNGISEAARAHIFEPFFTTKLGQGGSGLGLSISKNIASTMLHGSLYFEAPKTQGARFVLRFPKCAPEDAMMNSAELTFVA